MVVEVRFSRIAPHWKELRGWRGQRYVPQLTPHITRTKPGTPRLHVQHHSAPQLHTRPTSTILNPLIFTTLGNPTIPQQIPPTFDSHHMLASRSPSSRSSSSPAATMLSHLTTYETKPPNHINQEKANPFTSPRLLKNRTLPSQLQNTSCCPEPPHVISLVSLTRVLLSPRVISPVSLIRVLLSPHVIGLVSPIRVLLSPRVISPVSLIGVLPSS